MNREEGQVTQMKLQEVKLQEIKLDIPAERHGTFCPDSAKSANTFAKGGLGARFSGYALRKYVTHMV